MLFGEGVARAAGFVAAAEARFAGAGFATVDFSAVDFEDAAGFAALAVVFAAGAADDSFATTSLGAVFFAALAGAFAAVLGTAFGTTFGATFASTSAFP